MRNKKSIQLFLICLIFFSSGCAGLLKSSAVQTKEVEGKFNSLSYRLLTFESQDPQKNYPLLVALPGVGEDPANVFEKWYWEAEKNQVMVAVIDWRNPAKGKKISEKDVEALVLDLFLHYPIDEKKIFLAGTSAGGVMTEHLLTRDPSRWAGGIFIAYVPFSIWSIDKDLERFPSIFFAYGAKDPSGENQALALKMVEMKQKGMRLYLLVDPDAGHEHREEWNAKIFDWMKNQE